MQRVDGALARTFDFGRPGRREASPRLRLTTSTRLHGPDKYMVLEARRRRAQLEARRLLDFMDSQENGR